MANNNSQENIPNWLKELQENSWELELLISGGAIFSLFQLSDLFVSWIEQLTIITLLPGSGLLLMIGLIAIKILTLGFSIHLILRAYWLSLVCVNYVYPGGIRKEQIKWKNPFQIKINDKANLKYQIENVDRNCGRIMYLSIVSAFVALGLAILLFSLVFLMTLLENSSIWIAENAFSILFVVFLTYLIDLFSFGLLRKIPYFAYIIFPFFKVYDFLSLRKYYQHSLWLFNTNIKKGRFLIGALVFAFCAITLSYLSIYRYMHWPNLFDQREYSWQMADNTYMFEGAYMENWNEETVQRIGISEKVITGNLLELFVRYNRSYDGLIEQTNNKSSERSFDQIIAVEIDDSSYTNLNWFPTRKINNSIIGITTMIRLDSLVNGNHDLKVYTKYRFQDGRKEYELGGYQVKIPFWIDR